MLVTWSRALTHSHTFTIIYIILKNLLSRYECDCGKTFKRAFELQIHKKIHDLSKPLICELCGYTCIRKATLDIHIRRHQKVTIIIIYTCM